MYILVWRSGTHVLSSVSRQTGQGPDHFSVRNISHGVNSVVLTGQSLRAQLKKWWRDAQRVCTQWTSLRSGTSGWCWQREWRKPHALLDLQIWQKLRSVCDRECGEMIHLSDESLKLSHYVTWLKHDVFTILFSLCFLID